jgi:putative ABC transport system permease protein
MFRTRPLRTFLTILGVSVGIGTVLFLVSLGYGLQKAILAKITTADSLLSLDVSPGAEDLIVINQSDVDAISKISEVKEISPVINLSSQISTDDLTGDGLVYAVDSSYFRLSGLKVDQGREIQEGDNYEAVISSAGAKLFDFEPAEIIGKEFSLNLFVPVESDQQTEEIKSHKREEKYKIIGVVSDDSSNFIFIPRQTINDLGISQYNQLKVKISDSNQMELVRSQIIEMGFLVSSLSDTIDQANKIFRIIQIILALFGLVALIVSAIGMFNTMTIALLERINEIGIMRAIGISRSDVRKLFLFESIMMGFLGGVGGIIIGIIGGYLANFGINILAKTFGGQALNMFYYPPWFIIFIIIFSIVIGFLTGVYPSIRASKLNPLSALRYK